MKSKIINSLTTLFNNELKENLLKSRNKEEISNTVSNLIKNNIKGITANTYKVVIEILLNENKGQGINVNTRLFYNNQSDFFFKKFIENETHYCFIVVYLIHV
ncbi:dynein light chain, putative [Plasmodium yoelii]|uniref:Dynein light chain n=2 Tax=Plasmodium yoelii TaxID=5861 RepID=A0AAE9WN51_PLAYO|nr:dynein light chain, putative [Plasmodium yoelii]WBY57112.1 dynein light chain [Plasmodium yoelii yoelii]CDU17809.1 conserved Plasmodium protein, unknown function [Plasmodium yoelii]VTZ78226.1 dynein light chain, putative [Plasmodium yoelii]|eukprot:XP_022812105.1 dynein light chain, putative [Plasmodium yoelii]